MRYKYFSKLKQLFTDHDTRQLIKNGLKSFGIRGSAIIISFIINLILARSLGAKGYGIYAYAFSWSFFLGALATFGIDILLVREIAIYKSTNKWSYIRGILRFSNLIFYSIIFLLIVGTAVVLYFFNVYEEDNLLYVLLIGLISFPFIGKTLMNQSVVLGLNRIVFAQLSEKLWRPSIFLILIVLTVIFGVKINAMNAAIMNTSAFILVMFISGFYLTNALKEFEISKSTSLAFDNINWIKSAVTFFSINSLLLINTRADILMIGMMSDNIQDVGIYNVVVKVSEFLYFPIMILNVVISPLISEYYAVKNLTKLKNLVKNTAWILFGLTLPGIIIYIFYGNFILSIFGMEYKEGFMALCILCAGQLVNILCGCVATVLMMTEYEKFPAKSLIVSTVINLILNAILIPRYGITGAAIGTAVGLIIHSLLMLAYLNKKLGINTTIFGALNIKKSINEK